MSKQKNKDLILKTLKKIYRGTTLEPLVKDAKLLEEISSKELESSKVPYYLTHNLVKYYLKETMKEEKTPKFYQLNNRWLINYEICSEYLAGTVFSEPPEEGFFEGEKIQRVINKVWQEDDPQLDDCKGPGYLR